MNNHFISSVTFKVAFKYLNRFYFTDFFINILKNLSQSFDEKYKINYQKIKCDFKKYFAAL